VPQAGQASGAVALRLPAPQPEQIHISLKPGPEANTVVEAVACIVSLG